MDGFDSDAFVASNGEGIQSPTQVPAMAQQPSVGSFDPEQFIKDAQEEQYGTPGQMAITALEGAAEGVAGPLAPLAETKILGVPEEDILSRRDTNPITHGVGQGIGLTAGLLTGTGEAALMTKAGAAAADLSGLAKAAGVVSELGPQIPSFAARVGSSAVQQAAEMAVLQGSDEVSKLILKDPETSAQTAIANVGMASALGGAGGAFTSGVVSPLWSATAGPKIDQFLNTFKNHLNGSAALEVPEAVLAAEKELGVQLPPEMRAAFSGNPKAMTLFNELREAQHPTIVRQLKDLQEGSHNAILKSLNTPLQDVAHYSENEAGHSLFSTFTKEYDAKYGPIAAKLAERDALASTIAVADEERLAHAGKIIEAGMEKVGTDSPYFKLYDDYAQRLLAKDTIGGMDQLKTELYKRTKNLAIDQNEREALHAIRSSINDFQESQIAKMSAQLERDGVEFGSTIGKDLIADRALTNKQYAEFSKLSQELTDHLGVGDFKGAGTLKSKLGSKIAPEDLLKKFSPKGNADFIPFLQQYFPETLTGVRANEAKRFLRPSVTTDTGEAVLNVKKLNAALENGLKGAPEYTKLALNEDAINKIQAAKVLQDAIPDFKSSGTAGWLSKLTKHMPSSAVAAVGMLMGHGPITGYILGEAAQRLGKDAPEAIKLGLLNFLAADKPIQAESFKAAVDFAHNVAKGDSALTKGVSNVFKLGAKVIPDAKVPSELTRARLDRLVADREKNPEQQVAVAEKNHVGHYMPNHGTAMVQSSTTALQYLQSIKPKPFQPSPLDKPIDPTPGEMARYHRALDIAQNPAVVLQHAKSGTLQLSDIQDISTMYPGYYKLMVQKVSSEMANAVGADIPVPYKTRIGLSLLLGQALDSSMDPMSIVAAQSKPQQQQPSQGGQSPPKAMNKLGNKTNKMYQTPGQSAEADRGGRD